MKIREKIIILLISTIGYFGYAQTFVANLPQWQVTLRVADESGRPITNADTYVGYYIAPPPGATEAESKQTGVSDTNGFSTISGRSGPAIWYGANKAGFYSDTSVEYDFKNKAVDTWLPWNMGLNVILVKIVNPIPMYAKSVNLGLPVFDKPAGFDFMVGDWVEPYGKGKNSDIIFLGHLVQRARLDYDYKLIVSFPNKGDGIQTFTTPESNQSSWLRSPYQAPDGGYVSQYVQEDIERPDTIVKHDYDPKRNFFVRVQTVVDENGNVKSALYGKIYGDFMQFHYYLNPTPNSRNIEFDPNQNLFKNLPDVQQVKEP